MSVKPIPEGYHTINNFFTVRKAEELLQFLQDAFDAKTTEIHRNEDGTIMHAELKIGDSIVMMGEAPETLEDNKLLKSLLYMYVNDADSMYDKAIQAGGKSIMAPVNHFYGDRSGAVEDPAGNQWWIASHIEDMTAEELQKRAAQKPKQ